MPQVEAVVFDIGNVLIEWQPERFFDSVIGEERRKAFFADIDLHAMNDDVDRGADFHQTLAAFADANPKWRKELTIWHDRWIDMAAPKIDHSVRLLNSLRRAGVPVFALTNFGIQTFAIAEPVYPFLKDFDKRYISGHMGIIKPDALIYQMLEDDCGVAPQNLLFADDRIDNIKAAAARGWQTHLFVHPQGWADRLVAEGLIREKDAA